MKTRNYSTISKFFSLLLMASVALIISMASTVSGQTRIVLLSKADSIKVAWHHDWKDTTGAPELVAKFKIFGSANDTVFVYVADVVDAKNTGKPDTTCVIKGLKKGIRYSFGVSAVDYAGNESRMHTSSQSNAAYGGWYVIIDDVSPRSPSMIRPL